MVARSLLAIFSRMIFGIFEELILILEVFFSQIAT